MFTQDSGDKFVLYGPKIEESVLRHNEDWVLAEFG